ncbi:hypothetical protein WK57_30595 [Burkholderia ubonensis]|uniref:Uncharacterized protein n=1 Tax=Burkholderia ubonensis TaxID=101571 RepID=A0AA40UVP1_9BURK|nr:hypothetical protein [Burkholderia ubonensis]KWZ53340.1 hypothetical protein WK57_30595 [Burkholderia ubonensis]
MNDQQQSRADALTDDQRQALGESLSEYFGKLDSDEGIRAPEGRILRAFDYCDSRNVDDLIDRAIVPALAASPVEQPAAAPAVVTELARMTRMFHAACHDLGLINEALGLDPDDGGAAPILDAIAELKGRATSANETGAEGATDAKKDRWCPDECPVTGKPFFMWIAHPELGYVPTYGGPFDSYTIASPDDDGYFRAERYDHDEGSWVEGGAPVRVRRELVAVVDLDAAPATAALAPADEREAYSIEGIVRFMRSEAEKQVCVCCPPGGGHIFSRRVEWDEWKTNRAAHFGNGPDVLISSKVLDLNQNEGKRVRVTVEALDEARAAASPAAEAVTIPAGWKLMPIDAPESLLDVLCDAARGWPTYAEVRPIYDKLLADAPQPAQADASRTIPDECVASGASCSYAPEGRHGEMQCRYCGKAQADAPAGAGSGDAIARSKRILALVDDYHEKPTADSRMALRKALMAEFESTAPAARVASLTDEQILLIASQTLDADTAPPPREVVKFARDLLNGADQ